jgi:glycosyltransferase involved in cell wall biosynthesis
MKIAQVAPLIESVPPRLYGGTERIVSYLTEELVRLGHDVTLFASGDSVTTAELAPCCTRALRLDATVRDSVPHFMLMIDKVRERAKEFDVFHFHIDFFHFPLFRSLAARTLTTLHGRQDLADLKPFYSRFGFRCGSVPEVIEDGVTGKVVDSEDEAVAVLPEILSYDRRAVRQRFEDRFTSTRMAKDYVSTYHRLLKTRTSGARLRQPALNGGNGLAPVSIEKPFVALFEAGADPEIPI